MVERAMDQPVDDTSSIQSQGKDIYIKFASRVDLKHVSVAPLVLCLGQNCGEMSGNRNSILKEHVRSAR
jgi:hypothetical protein